MTLFQTRPKTDNSQWQSPFRRKAPDRNVVSWFDNDCMFFGYKDHHTTSSLVATDDPPSYENSLLPEISEELRQARTVRGFREVPGKGQPVSRCTERLRILNFH